MPLKLTKLLLIFCTFVFASFSHAGPKAEFNEVLKKHKGQVIYVDFWASWCGPCRKSFPWLNTFGIEILSTSVKI